MANRSVSTTNIEREKMKLTSRITRNQRKFFGWVLGFQLLSTAFSIWDSYLVIPGRVRGAIIDWLVLFSFVLSLLAYILIPMILYRLYRGDRDAELQRYPLTIYGLLYSISALVTVVPSQLLLWAAPPPLPPGLIPEQSEMAVESLRETEFLVGIGLLVGLLVILTAGIFIYERFHRKDVDRIKEAIR